jgi:hypothetical protein
MGGLTGTQILPPVITHQASCTVNPVTGTQTSLQFQASDPNGASLTYSWSVTGQPASAKTPTFDKPSSSQPKATFYQAGSYTFVVTVTDTLGLSASSSVTVSVVQTVKSISISPTNASVGQGGTATFAAAALDQFGNAMSVQPSFTWQVNGGSLSSTTGGSVTFVAGSPGTAQVKVSAGRCNAQANITVTTRTPAAPIVTQAASAQSSTVTGTATSLQVAASDPDGSTPSYLWSGALTNTAGVSFSNLHSSQTSVTFTQAGTYTLIVTVADALNSALTVTSSVTVTVVQTVTNISLTPANVALLGGQTQQFTVVAMDQFGQPITSAISGAWQLSGVGQISSTGFYTASGGNGTAQAKFSTSGGASAQANITVTAPPAAPTNLTASLQNGQITLQWANNSNNQTGFVIQYYPCCIPNPQWTTLASVASTNNSYTFTPPPNLGPTVEYQVCETNPAGSSPPSNAVTVTTPPAAPTGLSATASMNQITLSWAASTGATSYDVYRATSSGQEGNTPIATGVTASTFTDSNVVGGTTYYYQVTAVDAAGQSTTSSEADATLLQIPTAPSGLAVTAGPGNISLSWSPVNGASQYNVYRGTSSGGESFEISVSGTSFNDTSLSAFTTYYYQVSAVNSSGEGAKSTEVSGTPGNDWFANNLPDPGLQALARTDFNRDGSITYVDMLGLLTQADTEIGAGTMSGSAVASLQAIASSTGATYLNMAAPLQGLTQNLVKGGQYLTSPALNANSTTAAQLQALINQWFLGENLPTIDTQYWGTSGYVLANEGTLFGSSGGPLYTDIYQGEEGDCWVLASFAEIAYKQPGIIKNSFTDDGLVLENGVQVHVWTYQFYNGSTPEYMTLNNYFPSNGGVFMYADAYQTIANTANILWAPLMEKAYAQIYGGSYANLNGGLAQNILPLETGGSSGVNNPFGSESAYSAAIQSPNTLLTLASWSTNYGFVADHDYAVISVTGTGTTALFQLYNPWGTDQPPAITWAQLTQNGDFTQDGDTVVSSAAMSDFCRPNSGTLARTPVEFPAALGGDHRDDYFAQIALQLKGDDSYIGGEPASQITDASLASANFEAGSVAIDMASDAMNTSLNGAEGEAGLESLCINRWARP